MWEKTENKDHPVQGNILCSFFLHLLCIESLQATSESSRSEFFICVIERQNSLLILNFMKNLYSPALTLHFVSSSMY